MQQGSNSTGGGGATNDRERAVVDKLLDRTDITPDQLLELLRLGRPSTEAEVERIRGEAQRGQPWYVVAPWAALFTLIGTLGTGWLTGYFERDRAQDAQRHAVDLEGLRFRSVTFERLLVIDGTTLGLGDDADPAELLRVADAERKARICLAQVFGLIEIPEVVVGLPATSKEYTAAVNEIMNTRYGCDEAELPRALPAPTVPQREVSGTVSAAVVDINQGPVTITVQIGHSQIGIYQLHLIDPVNNSTALLAEGSNRDSLQNRVIIEEPSDLIGKSLLANVIVLSTTSDRSQVYNVSLSASQKGSPLIGGIVTKTDEFQKTTALTLALNFVSAEP